MLVKPRLMVLTTTLKMMLRTESHSRLFSMLVWLELPLVTEFSVSSRVLAMVVSIFLTLKPDSQDKLELPMMVNQANMFLKNIKPEFSVNTLITTWLFSRKLELKPIKSNSLSGMLLLKKPRLIQLKNSSQRFTLKSERTQIERLPRKIKPPREVTQSTTLLVLLTLKERLTSKENSKLLHQSDKALSI